MYDFPASPTEGQEFEPPGGPVYKFSSPKWLIKGGTAGGGGGSGSVAWDNVTGKPTTFPPTLPIAQSGVTNLVADYVNVTGDTMTGVLTTPAIAVGTTDGASAGNGIILRKRTSGFSENLAFGDGAGGIRANITVDASNFMQFRVGDNVTNDLTISDVGLLTSKTLTAGGADGPLQALFKGLTKGVRFTFNTVASTIEGVDSTGVGSYQPLAISGSQITLATTTATGIGVSNKLSTAVPTATNAMFRLPHGAAPSAPVDGDLWTTSAGMYVQVNSVTIGPLASLASPAFTGAPTAPTAPTATDTTQIATTAFVKANMTSFAPLASPSFTGDPKAPTQTLSDNDTSIATTAFVQGVVAGSLATKAPLADPVFTGNPQAPTPAFGDNDTSIATTAFVTTAVVTAKATADTDYVNVTGDAMTGDLTIAKAAPSFTLEKTAGQLATIFFKTGTTARWGIDTLNSAESGSNVGSEFRINRYNDAGGYVETTMSINRSTGAMSYKGNLSMATGWIQLTGQPIIWFDKGAGITSAINFRTGTSGRFSIQNADTESGSNTGANFKVARYNDAGVQIDHPLVINRATGVVDMPLGATTLTQPAATDNTSVATTAFVKAAIAEGGGGAAATLIADVAPTVPAPTQGQLWWDSSTANLYIWYDDGTSAQWVQVNMTGAA